MTVIISKENSSIIKKWSKNMNVSGLIVNAKRKEQELQKICKKFNVKKNEISFIGDDVNDIELMKNIGFSVCPNNGNLITQQAADYVCKNKGGEGAFRELVDMILIAKFPKMTNYY